MDEFGYFAQKKAPHDLHQWLQPGGPPNRASKWGQHPLDSTYQQSLLNLDMSGPLVSLSS